MNWLEIISYVLNILTLIFWIKKGLNHFDLLMVDIDDSIKHKSSKGHRGIANISNSDLESMKELIKKYKIIYVLKLGFCAIIGSSTVNIKKFPYNLDTFRLG